MTPAPSTRPNARGPLSAEEQSAFKHYAKTHLIVPMAWVRRLLEAEAYERQRAERAEARVGILEVAVVHIVEDVEAALSRRTLSRAGLHDIVHRRVPGPPPPGGR